MTTATATATANTFHDPTSRLLVDDSLKRGPEKDEDELARRAAIYVHNAVAEAFGKAIAFLAAYPTPHAETRQVAARAAEILDDLGREFRPS